LIQQTREQLDKIQRLLENDDSQQLFAIFAYANTARQRFLNQFEGNMSKSITFKVQPGGMLQVKREFRVINPCHIVLLCWVRWQMALLTLKDF